MASSSPDTNRPPEKRGYLLNDQSGRKEYFVLRAGILRSYRSENKGGSELLNQIHLAHSGEVNLLHDGVLEIKSHSPFTWEYTLIASSEDEAENWYDNFQSCIIEAQKKIQSSIELLKAGAQLVKYNYSNYKRTRRLFWISDNGDELRWGKSKASPDYSKVALSDSIGIIYGPVTTTFVRCREQSIDPGYCCFSLLFMGRTLDLATYGDMVHVWFLGLQYLISRYGSGGGSMPILSDSQFTIKKLQYKVSERAHGECLVYNRYLINKVNDLGQLYKKNVQDFWKYSIRNFPFQPNQRVSPGKTGTSNLGALPGASPPKPTLPGRPQMNLKPPRPGSTGNLPAQSAPNSSGNTPPNESSMRESQSSNNINNNQNNSSGLMDESSKQRILDLENKLRRLEMQQEIMKKDQNGNIGGNKSSSGGAVNLENEAVKYMESRCRDLEKQVIDMQEKIKLQEMTGNKNQTTIKSSEESMNKLYDKNKSLEDEVNKMKQHLNQEQNESTKIKSEKAKLDAQVVNLTQQLETEKKAASKPNDKVIILEKSNKDLSTQIEQVKGELGKKNGEVEMLTKQLKVLQQAKASEAEKNQSIKKKFLTLKQQILSLKKEIKDDSNPNSLKTSVNVELRSFTDTFMLPLRKHVQQIAVNMVSMQESFKDVQKERRRLHNLVLELKGNIRVFARVRPISESELIDEPSNGPNGTSKTIKFSEETKVAVYNDYDSRTKWFEFDKVFWPGSTQQDVFNEAEALAVSMLDGYNVCIFAYGQTGSGKTYTMRGPRDDPGLYSRVVSSLFKLRDEKIKSNKINLSVVITEIYNESLRDLLAGGSDGNGNNGRGNNSGNSSSSAAKIDVKLQPDGTVLIPGVEELPVQSVGEVVNAMNRADKNRAVATTDMNEHSSRSHQIVTIYCTNQSLETGTVYNGKIHLIDLAGSENVGKSGATGTTLKEAQNINKSLSALGDVIQALQQNKSGHIPYRNSKLTMMLRDSLGGDSKMLMIVQCSPAQSNVTETLSTLTFASRARQVELGKAKRNVKEG